MKIKKKFSIYLSLTEIIKYKNYVNNSIKYSPIFLFNCKNAYIINEVRKNIKDSLKNKNKNIQAIKKFKMHTLPKFYF